LDKFARRRNTTIIVNSGLFGCKIKTKHLLNQAAFLYGQYQLVRLLWFVHVF